MNDNSYGISDPAPWPLSIISGFQHFLTMVGGTVAVPYLLFPYYCVGANNPARGDIAAAMFFVSGIVTILQSAIGYRLPLIQGTSFAYLVPIFVALGDANEKCPVIKNNTSNISTPFNDEVWQQRISMIQGSLMLAALLQIFLGFTGLVGYLIKFVTPLTITPVQTLVGFAVLEESINYCSGNWLISMATVLLLVIFSENLKHVNLPTFSYSKIRGWHCSRGVPIFHLFPVLLVIVLVWLLCYILTTFSVFSVGNSARTDINSDVISQASWFRVPYPTQWGIPKLHLICVVGMLGATMANLIESVGNFYACARIANAPPPPAHAVNRGVLIEGLGIFLDGLIGIGNGTSSYAENIGIIGMTKIASRRVMYIAGFCMMLIGVFTKSSALFMVIPDPILGGVFIVLFCSIATIGLATLQYVDMNSSRNLLVIGLPIYCGLALPLWFGKNPKSIHTGNEIVDGLLIVFLRSGMLLGGILAILLDNLVPGTPEERGLIKWAELNTNDTSIEVKDYNLPLKNCHMIKGGWLQRIPICPGFKPINFKKWFTRKRKPLLSEKNSKFYVFNISGVKNDAYSQTEP